MRSNGRRLLLLRHAKAVTATAGSSDAVDHARALSERGRDDAAAMGELLRARGLMPERALVSTSLRTRETFELLRPPEPSRMTRHFSDHLYLASPDALLDVIGEESADVASLMLVGHNPGLHDLARELAQNHAMLDRGFATCTLAMVAFDGQWSELSAGRARLLEILEPPGRTRQS